MFLRRLGQKRTLCATGYNCPQILELTNGDFVVVGTDITEEAAKAMPAGPGIGPKERAVRIPRLVMVEVRSEIPTS